MKIGRREWIDFLCLLVLLALLVVALMFEDSLPSAYWWRQ